MRPQRHANSTSVEFRRCCRRAHLCSCCWVWFGLLCGSGWVAVANYVPSKGDEECPSLTDRAKAISTGANSSNLWYSTCDDVVLSYNPPPAVVPSYGFKLQMYSSLPAYAPHSATYLAWALVGYMKDVNELYDIGINSTTLESLLFGALSQQDGIETYAAEVVFQEVLATNIWRDLATYWWRYDFIFYCYWGELWKPDRIGQPLDDPATLRQIHSDLNRSLRRGLQLIDNAFNLWEQSTGVLGLSHIDPTTVDDPFEDFVSTQAPVRTRAPSITPAPSVFGDGDAGTNMPVNKGRDAIDPGTGTIIGLDPEVTFQSPLDNKLWDWRRYVGLTVFVGTVMGFLVLSQIAAYRRRQKQRKHIWGNLGTEEGVNALLDTGWKVKGSRMEVFDKRGWGYRDDDSMLMGGYFDPSAFVGAEITVTQDSATANTITTPDIPDSVFDASFQADG